MKGAGSDPLTRLASRPLDVEAELAAAGRLNQRAPGGGEPLLDFASRRTWRDPELLLRRVRLNIADGDLADAVGPADALLRLDAEGVSRPGLFPLLIAVARDDAAREELAARLRRRPEWRVSFLQTLGWQADPDLARAVLSRTGPLSEGEVAPLLEHEVGLGRFVQVLDDERRLWPSDRPRTVSAWAPVHGGGVAADLRPAPTGAEPALQIAYDGLGPGPFPRRLLTLKPGRYQILARHDHPGPAGVGLSARCAEDGRLLDAERAEDAAGSALARLSIVVPAQACAGLWVGFEPAGRQRLVETTDVYSDLRVAAGPDS